MQKEKQKNSKARPNQRAGFLTHKESTVYRSKMKKYNISCQHIADKASMSIRAVYLFLDHKSVYYNRSIHEAIVKAIKRHAHVAIDQAKNEIAESKKLINQLDIK